MTTWQEMDTGALLRLSVSAHSPGPWIGVYWCHCMLSCLPGECASTDNNDMFNDNNHCTCWSLLTAAIKRPRTRSAWYEITYEWDLVTNENKLFRLWQPYFRAIVLQPNISENLFSSRFSADGYKGWCESAVLLVEFNAFSVTCTVVSLACSFSSDVSFCFKSSEESLQPFKVSFSHSCVFFPSLCQTDLNNSWIDNGKQGLLKKTCDFISFIG